MFPCEVCFEQFKVKRNMLRHVKSQHANVKFTCELCLKSYTRKYNLTRHVRDEHGENNIQLDPTPPAENEDLWGDEEELIRVLNEFEKSGKILHYF
jgi:uncharacterized Zn-finger protein